MFSNLTPETVLALIALIGSLISNIVQYANQKGNLKKSEAEASGVMIEMALKLNRSELDTLRQMNQELKEDLRIKESRINELETRLTKAILDLGKLQTLAEDNHILKLSLEAVQCELSATRDELKHIKGG
jgi:dynactin complex subunit